MLVTAPSLWLEGDDRKWVMPRLNKCTQSTILTGYWAPYYSNAVSSPAVKANHEMCDCLGQGNWPWQAWDRICGQGTGYLVHDHTTPFHGNCEEWSWGLYVVSQSVLPSFFQKLLLFLGLWSSLWVCVFGSFSVWYCFFFN